MTDIAAPTTDAGRIHALLSRFEGVYNALTAENVDTLDALYTEDVTFIDPFHEIGGLDALKDYCRRMYAGVDSCRFEFGERVVEPDRAVVTWTMVLRMKQLRPHETLRLPGCSHIRFGEGETARIHYHRDYFDAGALLYERVPLVGPVVRMIKNRL